MATTFQDQEFGTISIRRSHLARSLRLKIDPRGGLVVSMPKRAPLYLAKQLINGAREHVRKNLQTAEAELALLQDGDLIGKSHRLVVRSGDMLQGKVRGGFVEVAMPPHVAVTSKEAQAYIKQIALKALRTQAKAYLTRRLAALATAHGFMYKNVRFSNAGTRWGSCSSRGTISLNIWLMQLPFELIDYVILHELCHTQHMNHSPEFWRLVEEKVPAYKQHRRVLKTMRPYL